MPSFTNVTTALKLKVDGAPLKYADLLKTVATTPTPVINDGVVTYPPGLTVAQIEERLSLIAACDAAISSGATIDLTSDEKILALSLVDSFLWTVTSSDVVAFRAALFAAA